MARQKLPPFPFRIFILPAVALPAGAFIAFLQNHPLSAHITSQIQASSTPSPSCAASESVRHYINPSNHVASTGCLSIRIPEGYLHGRSDEEILARLTKGYFEGVIFQPEKILINLLEKLGRKLVSTDFSGESIALAGTLQHDLT